MAKLTIEITADAPIDVVFSTFTDFAHAANFISGIDTIEVTTPGPIGAGTTFRETRTMYGRSETQEIVITGYDPPNRIQLGAKAHGASYNMVYAFALRDGGTAVTLTFGAEPLTVFAKIMSVLTSFMTASMRRMLERDMAEMKAEAERRARAEAS